MKTRFKNPSRKKPSKAISFVKTQSKRFSKQKAAEVKKPFIKKMDKSQILTPKKPIKTKPTLPSRKIITESTLAKGLVRLEKYMAQSGMTSRREAKDLIEKGKVTVNGKIARNPGTGINPEKDSVEIKGKQIKETLIFYKPRGIETSKTTPDSSDIHDKFPQFAHLSPVGRLDKDSEGLILLSNDGVLTKIITGEKSNVEKEYRVSCREDVMPAMLVRLETGILLDNEMTKPCVAKKTGKTEFTITLTEGRKHQVRRMANACKLTVTRLVRVRIGEVRIGRMTAGNFKKLPDEFVQAWKK